MKKIITAAVFCLFGLQGYSQIFQFGLRGGVNLQKVNIKEFDGDQAIEDLESGNQKLGFHAGVYGRINLAVIFIQPELLYTFQNGEVKYQETGGNSGELKVRYSRFDVPVIVGTSLGPVRLGVGPVATFAISEPDDAFEQSLNNATFGFQVGAGLDLGKLSIDLRYEGPFSKTADNITIDGTEYTTDARTSQIILGLGFQLF